MKKKEKEMQIKIIPIGTKVEVNNFFKGIIISVSIRKEAIVYEIQKTTKDGIIVIWSNHWEITSKHKEKTIINQCLELEKN